MLYLPELYYLQDHPQFPFWQAVRLTAATVARWCTHFEAKLIAPNRKIEPAEQRGRLPTKPKERADFVSALVDWLIDCSLTDELF